MVVPNGCVKNVMILHWAPVKSHKNYKILYWCHHAVYDITTSQAYLREDLIITKPVRFTRSSHGVVSPVYWTL